MSDFLREYSGMEEAAYHFLWQSYRDLYEALRDDLTPLGRTLG